MISRREELLNYVKFMSEIHFTLTLKDRIKGNFGTKLRTLQRELIKRIEANNLKNKHNKDLIDANIKDIDVYMDKLEQETIDLFTYIQGISSFHTNEMRYSARVFVDSEIKPLRPILKNEGLELSLSIYCSNALQKLKDTKYSRDIIPLLMQLIEIEDTYFKILMNQDVVTQSIVFDTPVFKFNRIYSEGLMDRSLHVDILSDVSDFITKGLGIAGTIESSKEHIEKLSKLTEELIENKEKLKK